MGNSPDTHDLDAEEEPNRKLLELTELLVGTWRVAGPDITGQAEYQPKKGGHLLVAYVDFRVGDATMRLIQHISYDQGRDTLRARYMDTMGDEATYTWVLEHPEIRVSRGDEDSDTYFRASFNEDSSRYAGTWHSPEGAPSDATESIVYTRMSDEG